MNSRNTHNRNRRDDGLLLSSESPSMVRTLTLATGVAPTPATVLITGESGTGKEVIARSIHGQSARSRAAFVAVNCGAMPATLVESELFGHERGAFSGAVQRRVGRFEAADRGTLLLDEISEMPLEGQTRLLRVLQEREVTRVGSSTAIPVDARIIATTNRDLRQMVVDGQFREDLYYRINVFPIHVPPLRERRADLAALSAAILVRRCRRFGCPVVDLGEDALDVLSRWTWPGNVRELQNVLERALVLSQGAEIGAQHIVLDEVPLAPAPRSTTLQAAPAGGASSLRDLEQDTILNTLSDLQGNRTRTAQRLGISIRTLRNRLRDYRSQGVPIPAPTRGVASHLLRRSI